MESGKNLASDPWAFGPWCWVVDDVRLLPKPVPARGMQGLWPIDSAPLVHALDELAGVRQRWSALTLLQPYASAIAVGPKRIENRPWRRRVPPGGLWVALHAGKGLFNDAAGLVRVWREVSAVTGQPFGLWPGAPDLAGMPRGCLLGVMHIANILKYPETTS